MFGRSENYRLSSLFLKSYFASSVKIKPVMPLYDPGSWRPQRLEVDSNLLCVEQQSLIFSQFFIK